MTTATIPTFSFSLASLAVAEARLNLKISEIIAEIQSQDGMALRTLRTLMAAGMPPLPRAHRWLVDTMADQWVADSERQADRLILKFGTAACASAVGPDLGAFLLTMEGPQRG